MSSVTALSDAAPILPLQQSAPGFSTDTLLIIDDSPLCREMVGKSLKAEGYSILTAGDGLAGLEVLAKQSIRLILLDNEMPRMTGMEFLKAIRADPRWARLAVIMLSTTNSKEAIVEAMKHRICGYVLKEKMSMPELFSRIRTVLNPSPARPAAAPIIAKSGPISAPNLVTRDNTLASITDCEQTKTLAGVAKQLTAISDSAKASAADLASVVRQDPVLAARVIQLASSSAYAGSKLKLNTIDDAVRTVGVSAVRDLAMSVGVFNAFPADRADGLDLFRCWQHAFATAAVMTRIVPKTDSISSGVPHLIGLCHDLVEIILRQRYPSEYTAAFDFAAQAGVPLGSLLPAVFGASFEEMTDAFLGKLKFPAQAADVIRDFAKPRASGSVDSYSGTMLRSLAIANATAHGLLLTSSVDSLVMPVTLADCRSSLIPSAALNTAEIHSEAITTVCMLSDVSGEQSAALSKPIAPRRTANVLYLRHPLLAPLDPLQAALKSLAKPETRETMPSVDDLAEFDAIIATAPSSADPLFSSAMRARQQMAKPIPLLMLPAGGESPADPFNGETGSIGCPVPLRQLAQFIAKLPARAG